MKILNISTTVITALILILTGGGWWFFQTIGEGEKPLIKFSEELKSVGREKVVDISFEDMKSGLRKISISVSQDNKSQLIAAFPFPKKGVKQKTVRLTVSPLALKLHDGAALLRVSAVDYSLRKNETLTERPLKIDLTPPQIFLLTPTNNINPGGCCVIAFSTSEPAALAGVQTNGNFSQAYPVLFAGKPAFIAYFGIPMDTRKESANIKITVRDEGGNETTVLLPTLIRNKKFRSDKMKLADTFLNQKMLDFQPLPPELQGKNPVEIFTYVNGQLRNANENKIIEICRQSEPKRLWEGTFLRMKDASPMAMFGDRRTYMYGKKAIGESVHFGVDLASLAHAPVEAANGGIVKYTGNLGIYGNAIIIDHGLGIFSVYGHLSVINAKVGQPVKKGEIIGNTGTTGLAGGDHLHFGMVVGGRFVNPIEWWDEHWIKDNITAKLSELQSRQ